MRRLAALASTVLVTAGLAAAPADAAGLDKVPTATGSGGAVSTVDPDATKAGLDVLKHGGNAVDAAVAAAATLGVTEPFSCGIGGGGFMVIYNARDKSVHTIDSREKAPAAMKPDSFWSGGKPMSFNDARFSGMSAGVPGTVAAWDEALDKYGTQSLGQALRPAEATARNGFTVDKTFNQQVTDVQDYFDDVPSTAKLYLPGGAPAAVGSTLKNPDLARTYEKIGRGGPKSFYSGPLASAMVDASQHPPVADDANHSYLPGVMTARDLREYTAPERKPSKVDFHGLDVYSMAPPSSGGTTVGEALNILSKYDLESMPREEALHYYIEASRYAFADRNAYVADPDYVDVPTTGLLSKGFADDRRALIGPKAADPAVVAPGDPWPYNGGGSGAATPASTENKGLSTTHLTVTDKWGNVVSYTFTIESTGGNAIVVPGYGFLMNNELTDFNYDSLSQVNHVDGGKRPRSSISPTIVLDHGKPKLAVGSPGGSTIITTVLQILWDRLGRGASLPDAIAAPRASQRNTASTQAEPAFLASPEAAALKDRGQVFTSTPDIGAATGIEFLPGGKLLAAAEPVRRGGGAAAVVHPG